MADTWFASARKTRFDSSSASKQGGETFPPTPVRVRAGCERGGEWALFLTCRFAVIDRDTRSAWHCFASSAALQKVRQQRMSKP